PRRYRRRLHCHLLLCCAFPAHHRRRCAARLPAAAPSNRCRGRAAQGASRFVVVHAANGGALACDLDGTARSALSDSRFTHVTTDIALFFSKLGIVTFGGAYSVLAYMAQQVVETYGWLSAGVLVTELVRFLAGFRHGGEPKLALGLLGAAVTLWGTF